MQDKHGNDIKAGDTLFNPHDRDQYHTVLQGEDGKFYLGDFDSPLERYAPQTWWEVVHNAEVSGAGTASAGLPGYAGDNKGE
jgi:hypothetical protein